MNNLNWTPEAPPTEGVSFYDHTMSETPVGMLKIEWKSWKDSPSYDVELDGKWIGGSYTLADAKELAQNHLFDIIKELTEFLNINTQNITTSTCELYEEMNGCPQYRFRKEDGCKHCKYKK